jgi:hypothetical protein
MANNKEKIIPVEICLIKTIRRRNEIYDETLYNYLERIDRRLTENQSMAIFRSYGWFDYVSLLFYPHTRCHVSISEYNNDEYKYDSGLPIMSTSFMAWYPFKTDTANNEKNPYLKTVALLREVLGKLTIEKKENIEQNTLTNIILKDDMKAAKKDNGVFNRIYAPKNITCVLSFIKLSEYMPIQINKQVVENYDEILCGFIIFNYLGIWDLSILAVLDKRINIDKYKELFLINKDLPIEQSSSIILTQVEFL